MVQLYDRTASKVWHNPLIPPVVYQTWQDNLFGRTHHAEIERFRNLNGDLSFNLFNDKQADLYMEEYWGNHAIGEIYKQGKYGPLKSDIFRYCILCERGGLYFDINKGCNVSLSSLISNGASGFISYESNDCLIYPPVRHISKLMYPNKYILNWGVGFQKNHEILRRMIDNICEYYPFFKNKVFENPSHAIVSFTGTGMFTRTIWELMDEIDELNVDQLGIDFNRHGDFAFKGSWVRYLKAPSYADARNSVIVT